MCDRVWGAFRFVPAEVDDAIEADALLGQPLQHTAMPDLISLLSGILALPRGYCRAAYPDLLVMVAEHDASVHA